MQINGYDYHFAYTVGAYCAIAELKLGKPKTMVEQINVISHMAVLMSKGYEDKRKQEDPSYQVRYLTMEEVNLLSVAELLEGLAPEVNAAVEAGSVRTVEAKEPKNAEGAAKSSN